MMYVYICSFAHNESGLLEWLAFTGPVAVAVDATNWNNYMGGVIQYHCSQQEENHAILLVGYDLTGMSEKLYCTYNMSFKL